MRIIILLLFATFLLIGCEKNSTPEKSIPEENKDLIQKNNDSAQSNLKVHFIDVDIRGQA